MTLADLKSKSIKASVWSSIDSLSQQGLRFVITMMLARLLTPSDFGVVGMLAIFIGLSLAFVESGFPFALIQQKEIFEIDISSVFYFNIAMGLLCAVLLSMAAPSIAAFYHIPVLKPLTWLISANLFIGSLGSVQNTLLIKELNFKKICMISISSTIISGIVALILAWRQYGIWSLGIQTILATTITTILLWTWSSWRPRLIFSIQSIRKLFKYSSYILFTVLADVLYTRLSTIVIGKWYSASDLGFFTRADQTQQLPGGLILRSISRIAFPVFAAARDDKVMLKAGIKKAITATMFINIPLMFGLVVTAKPLILILFGNQWVPCVPYLQILSIGGILLPVDVMNMNVLIAQGHSDLLFRLTLIKKLVGIVLVGIACFFSISAIAWSVAVAGIVCFFINAHYTGTILGYGAYKQLRDVSPYLVGSIVMATSSLAVNLFTINGPFVLVLLQVAVGLIVYLLFCYIFKLNEFVAMLHLIRNYSTVYYPRNDVDT